MPGGSRGELRERQVFLVYRRVGGLIETRTNAGVGPALRVGRA
jgi:hypothetical protein